MAPESSAAWMADRILPKGGLPRLKQHYSGHGFVPKLGNPVVQAADLLAWQWLKDRKNAAEGRPRRKDLASLIAHRHAVSHIERPTLEAIAENKERVTESLLNLFGRERLA